MERVTQRSRPASSNNARRIPQRQFGRVAEPVSALGLGGYHLGLVSGTREAVRIVHEAIDAGVTFMDNAWEYNEHRSEELMGKAREIVIVHNGREYRLRLTQNGKLILTA